MRTDGLLKLGINLLLPLITASVSMAVHASEVQPLYFKHLKYLEHTQKNIGVLSQIMAYEKIKQLGNYSDDASLLKAQLLLQKGLHDSADELLEKIINSGDASPVITNQARFYLGKSYYQQQKIPRALSLFDQVGEPLDAEKRAELQHLKSLSLMRQGQYQQAAQYLRNSWWNAPGTWDLYARLNLAVSLIHSGERVQGADLLRQLGEKRFSDNESRAIVDKANQMLGFLQLSENKPEKARHSLEKIRPQGPYANLALLGAGWASVQLGEYESAVNAWKQLRKNDIRDIVVQESMLALPYAMDKLGNRAGAARAYQEAIDSYEDELKQLSMTMQSLPSRQLRLELHKLEVLSDEEWQASIKTASSSQPLRYIQQLIDDAEFFRLLNLYREARLLQYSVDVKIEDLANIQNYLNSASVLKTASTKNQNRSRLFEARVAELDKRSHQLRLAAEKNTSHIADSLQQRSLQLLQQREQQLKRLLIQSKQAMAQPQALSDRR